MTEQTHSSFDLSQYERKRTTVATLAERLAQVAHELGAAESAAALRQAVRSTHDEVFKIVVVGEFSRGKSSVINALVGKQVLPKSPSETTAVLSQIDFGVREKYTIHFRDDLPVREISPEDFARLVAPPEPDYGDSTGIRNYEERLKHLHSIDYVQIENPSELCRDGVRLIDTPGTNGLNPAREEITYKFIPNADAVIFVLSAQTPATSSELSFLRDQVMTADLGKIFLVMNFADSLATPIDRERVVSHAKHVIGNIIPSPEIFLVSAREALSHRLGKKTRLSLSETGYPLLESELAAFLATERGWVRLSKPVDRGARVAAELRLSLALKRSALAIPLGELKKRADEIKPRLRTVGLERDAALASLRIELSNKGKDLSRDWRMGLEKIATLAEAAHASYRGPINGEELLRFVEHAVARPQTDLIEAMQGACQDAIHNSVQAAQERLKETWSTFHVEFNRAFSSDSDWLAAPDQTADWSQFTPEILDFANIVGGFLGLMVAIVGGLFYMFKSERSEFDDKMRFAIKERYHRSIPQRVDKWLAAWTQQITQIESTLNDECSRKIFDLKNQLNGIVKQHRTAEHSAGRELARLSSLENEIDSLQKELLTVKADWRSA